MDEGTLAVGIAKRPSIHPHVGDDVLLRDDAGVGHVVRVRRLVAFTRSWSTLELASFTVETDAGDVKVKGWTDPDGLWTEADA